MANIDDRLAGFAELVKTNRRQAATIILQVLIAKAARAVAKGNDATETKIISAGITALENIGLSPKEIEAATHEAAKLHKDFYAMLTGKEDTDKENKWTPQKF
jgi:Holliday junction resolvasome RuvABC DNA-binding subunit